MFEGTRLNEKGAGMAHIFLKKTKVFRKDKHLATQVVAIGDEKIVQTFRVISNS